MNALKNKGLLVLAGSALMALGACTPAASSSEPASSTTDPSSSSSSEPAGPTTYARENDEEVYNRVLGAFAEDYDGVKKIANDSQRFVAYARAEASLLESGVMAITTTQGGAYGITRIAPRTAPYVFFGNDSDKIKGLVMIKGADTFIKGSERAEMIELWKKAAGGEGTYDPAAYLTGKGYEIGTEYKTTFSTANATFDVLDTSMQADTEQLVNCVEGLIQYNNLGNLGPAMADRWEISEDFSTYKFHIREGAKWFQADGTEAAAVTADDFVAGFQHMLDGDSGLSYLVEGVVKGVEAYLYEGASFDEVGCKVDEEGNLVFELEAPESYFITRLAYSCFMPMNRAFFKSKGGAFGSEYDPTAETYTYGKSADAILYNGAYLPQTWDATDSGGSVVLVKNDNYWDAANTKVTKATWVYDDGSNPSAIYAAMKAGDYPGMSLTEGNGTLAMAKSDDLFDEYHYVSDTNAVTYFGGLNLNRGTFGNANGSCRSPQSEEAKILTHAAMQNQNFRRAIMHGWDRGTWNAVVYGEDLKYNNLRNMYTQPDFVSLAEAVTFEGKEFAQGLSYGECVQAFLEADGETHIDVADGQDGWYDPEYATELMGKAKAELADVWAAGEQVQIDIVALGTSKNNLLQATSFKKILEDQFKGDILVNIQIATNTADYYSGGYRTKLGADENADIFYGSGWGPDYGDPSTYLDTFAAGGYMCKVIGLF